MSKLTVSSAAARLSMEALSSSQLLISLADEHAPDAALFQLIAQYQSLDSEIKYLFKDMSELYQALSVLLNRQKEDSFHLESNGRISFYLQVNVCQKIIKKTLTFQLRRQLNSQEEVSILRANVTSARKEISELKEAVQRLSDENNQLKTKFAYLEQLILVHAKQEPKQDHTKKPSNHPGKEQTVKETFSEKQQEVLQEKEEWLKVVPLKVEIDPACMYYSKFIIEDNRIASQHEDYYQIYNKHPLPKRGIYSVRVKMAGENHMSMGLLGKSALNNQYSFQNNKAICLYSYFYGNFRGIYFRSKYEPLSWIIEKGEEIDLLIDMNQKEMKIGSKTRKGIEIINFRSLYEQEPIYFFIEMYERNNLVEFLQ